MKARGRATGVASGARAGGPHGNHLHPKWSSVPPDHLGHQVTNKRGPPEEYRALRLDGRAGVVYSGDAKHMQASSPSHERVGPPTQPQLPNTRPPREWPLGAGRILDDAEMWSKTLAVETRGLKAKHATGNKEM